MNRIEREQLAIQVICIKRLFNHISGAINEFNEEQKEAYIRDLNEDYDSLLKATNFLLKNNQRQLTKELGLVIKK